MTRYGKIRHTSIAVLLVFALASLVGVGVAHEPMTCECIAGGVTPIYVLPEVEVVAKRGRSP